MRSKRTCKTVLCNIYIYICRVFAIFTAVVLYGVGAEEMDDGEHILLGYYLLREQRRCSHCWTTVLLFDDWRRGLLYALLGVGSLIKVHFSWLIAIPGTMLLFSSVLYFVKTFNYETEMESENSSLSFSKYEDDDLDENLITTAPESV